MKGGAVMARLGDVCEIQAGGTPSRSNATFWEDGNIPWVKISDFSGKYLKKTSEFITEDGLNNSAAKIFPKGTILYSIFATLGETCVLDIDAATNQAIAGIKIINNQLESDYLYYFLLSLKPYINQIGRGVAQNNINLKILREIEIPIPDIETQRHIAAVLDKVSDVIRLRKQQLAKLDDLIKARFVEMFGDPILVEKNGNLSQLGRICELKAGLFVKADYIQKESKDGLYPCFGGNGCRGYVPDYTHDGDFPIIGRQGALCGNVKYAQGKFHATEHAIVVTPLIPMNRYWIYHLLAHLNLNRYATGAAQPGLAVNNLEKIHVQIPKHTEQEHFAKFANQANNSKAAVQKALDETQLLFDSLMQKFFG